MRGGMWGQVASHRRRVSCYRNTLVVFHPVTPAVRCPLDLDEIPLGQLFMAAAFFVNLLILTRLYYAVRTINGRVTILSGLVREFGRRQREDAALESLEITDGGAELAAHADALALLEKADAELQGRLGSAFSQGVQTARGKADVVDFLMENLPVSKPRVRPPPAPLPAPAAQPMRLDTVEASGSDKRQHPRASLTARVQFRFDTMEAFLEAYSRDISEGGVFVKTGQPRPVGTRVFIQVALPNGAPMAECQARVVRQEPGVGMALAFDVLDEPTRRVLQQLVGTGVTPPPPEV